MGGSNEAYCWLQPDTILKNKKDEKKKGDDRRERDRTDDIFTPRVSADITIIQLLWILLASINVRWNQPWFEINWNYPLIDTVCLSGCHVSNQPHRPNLDYQVQTVKCGDGSSRSEKPAGDPTNCLWFLQLLERSTLGPPSCDCLWRLPFSWSIK